MYLTMVRTVGPGGGDRQRLTALDHLEAEHVGEEQSTSGTAKPWKAWVGSMMCSCS